MTRWIKAAALATGCSLVTALAWIGYHAVDLQAAWAALLSLCAAG